MVCTPTKVDPQKVDEWKARLPKRLHIFMENFFGTCAGLTPAENFVNYTMDIRLYSAEYRAYRENAGTLIEAFYDITGWRPTSAADSVLNNPKQVVPSEFTRYRRRGERSDA